MGRHISFTFLSRTLVRVATWGVFSERKVNISFTPHSHAGCNKGEAAGGLPDGPFTLHSRADCNPMVQKPVVFPCPFSPHSRADCNQQVDGLHWKRYPSLRTLVRIATAYMHKMFGACTDYYVHLNLIECEGRPGDPGSYSHYLDFGTGSRPLILVRSSYTKYVCFRLAQTQPQICDG